MMGTTGNRHAVIMGDLVGSEASLPTDELHALFNRAVDEQSAAHAAALVSPLTITLGDEFQGLVTSLAVAALIARDLRLQLLAGRVDCRFVIGLVEIKTPLNPDKAWNMMGPGLARAREKLNQKKADHFYRFSLEEAPVTELLLDALGVGLSVIERGWTEQQRNDISALLGGLSPADLAQRRAVSVHSIYKVRASGEYDSYRTQWEAVIAALDAMDRLERLN